MRAPLVISGRQVHRPPSDGTLDGCVHEHPYALSTREGRGNVSFRYRGIFTPSINRARRNAQFIIDLHADSSYIIRPRFLGLEQFQSGTRDNGRMDAGDSVYGGVFNRSSILSCGVIGAFCRILQHDARSSVVMKAILVLCSLFYDTVSVDWIERRRYVGICTNFDILLIFRFNLIFLER